MNYEITRCYGRTTNANFPQEPITPTFLPWKEKLVELMAEKYHKILHVGVNHTLSQISTKHWIFRGETEVKNVLRKCISCCKYQVGPFKISSISPWPKNKLTRSTAFKHTGLDYFGRLYIKLKNQEKKRHGSVYSRVINITTFFKVISSGNQQFIICVNYYFSIVKFPSAYYFFNLV